MNEQIKSVRDLASEEFDTRTLLRDAVDQAIERHYEDLFIVDVDSHHYETESFKEITQYMDNPVMLQEADCPVPMLIMLVFRQAHNRQKRPIYVLNRPHLDV